MGLLDRWKYRGLLLTLTAMVAAYPVLRTADYGRLEFNLVCSAVFLAVLGVVFANRRFRAAAAILGLPTLIAVWTDYPLPGLPRPMAAVGVHLLTGLFFGVTAAAVLRAVRREPEVSADGLAGAFCGYLLVGLVFGHAYCVLDGLTPGAFRWAGELGPPPDEARREFLLAYFSLTTLTTVGFGDITPANDAARGLAATEALVGQFYLAVLIGELVGKRVGRPAPAVTPPPGG